MRIAAMLLLFALILSAAACGKTPATVPPAVSDDVTSTQPIPTESTPEPIPTGPISGPPGLPAYLPEETYDGAEVRIWTAGGEPLVPERAIIMAEGMRDRDEYVESVCDVVLCYDFAGGDGAQGLERLRKNLLSGEVYDIVEGEAVDLLPLALNGSFLDLADSIYIDLTQPWWLSSLTEILRVGAHYYTAAGFFSADTLSSIRVWYFSDSLATEYALGDLHGAAADGTWTWDRMTEMCERVAGSVNGEGNVRYGLSGRSAFWAGETAAAGYQLVTNDGEGGYAITGVTDTLLELHAKIYPMITASDAYLSRDTDGITGETATSLFTDDRILFYQDTLAWSYTGQNGAYQQYGILPPPKYVETQAAYAAVCTPYVSAIPVGTRESVRAAVLLEMLQWASYCRVRPGFTIETMSAQYMSDRQAVDVLLHIFAAVTTDFARNALGREAASSPLFALFVFADPAAVLAEHADELGELIGE